MTTLSIHPAHLIDSIEVTLWVTCTATLPDGTDCGFDDDAELTFATPTTPATWTCTACGHPNTIDPSDHLNDEPDTSYDDDWNPTWD